MVYDRPVANLISMKYLTLKMVGKPCWLRLCNLLGVLKTCEGRISLDIASCDLRI